MYAQDHNFKFLVLIFVILFKTPVYSWGFSFERTESYLKRAEALDLAEHPQWIKLGHYRKIESLFRTHYKSGFSAGFFISPNGASSPSEELTGTIKLLYSSAETYTSENKEHPQCYYLARTQWLNRILDVSEEDKVPCPERTAWKKDLNTSSVSLIFAAGDMSNAASTFGHTFLKLNNPQNQGLKDLLNYGIDYSADADDSEGFFYAIKGLFGFYNGQFAMLPFHQKILEYTNVEGRDIWEYQLNFSKEETEFLINHLLEMEKARAPYYFMDENCSTQILRTLEVVRPDLNLVDPIRTFVVPIDTVKLVERSGSLVQSTTYKPALKTEFNKTYKLLSAEQKDIFPDLVKDLKFPNSIKSKFSNQEKAQLLEAAAAALSLEAFRKKINLDDQKYQLYLQRVELGPGQAASGPEEKSKSPTKSHDSTRLSYGRLGDETIIKFRGAFHELEQPHDGLIPHSHIEAIAVSARVEAKTRILKFDRFTVLNLINLNPSNRLENNMAWKTRIEFMDRFRPDFEGGIGSSLSMTSQDELRATAFLTARYTEAEQAALGPELLMSYHPLNSLGLSLSGTYFFIKKHNDYLRTVFKSNWQFYDKDQIQLDVRWQYENLMDSDFKNKIQFENKFMIGFNFIL